MDSFARYKVKEKVEIPQIFDIFLRSSAKYVFFIDCLAFSGRFFTVLRAVSNIFEGGIFLVFVHDPAE